MAKKKPKSRFAIGGLSYNKHHWQLPYPELRSGHRYILEGGGKAGHDSLNFDFNKQVDDDKYVFGYIAFSRGNSKTDRYPDRFSQKNDVMFMWAKNLDTNKGEIVGVYSGYKNVKPAKTMPHKGFDEGYAFFNIKAEKEYSMLFPVPLDSKKYANLRKTDRLVGQFGMTYIDQELAETIITDELNGLSQSATELDAYKKLLKIYEYITGREYKVVGYKKTQEELDEDEQEELENLPEIKTKSKQEIIQYLQSLDQDAPTLVKTSAGKHYKTNTMRKKLLKIIHGYKCQVCGSFILKKDGGRYVEAAHIQDKAKKGTEESHNILILCPNHHKEFDYGDRKIIVHTNDKIIVDVNGKRWQIDLRLGNP